MEKISSSAQKDLQFMKDEFDKMPDTWAWDDDDGWYLTKVSPNSRCLELSKSDKEVKTIPLIEEPLSPVQNESEEELKERAVLEMNTLKNSGAKARLTFSEDSKPNDENLDPDVNDKSDVVTAGELAVKKALIASKAECDKTLKELNQLKESLRNIDSVTQEVHTAGGSENGNDEKEDSFLSKLIPKTKTIIPREVKMPEFPSPINLEEWRFILEA